MNRTNKIIIGLVTVAALLFVVIQFVIIPANRNKQLEYLENQTDALTHDITAAKKYKSQFIGDAVNVSNMFYELPLNNISMKFEIDSSNCSLTVYYSDTVVNIGEEKIYRDLIYNTAAAMAAIDNLSSVTYDFSGVSFSFDRKQMEEVLGSDLSGLLDEDVWKEKVQNRLRSNEFVTQFYSVS